MTTARQTIWSAASHSPCARGSLGAGCECTGTDDVLHAVDDGQSAGDDDTEEFLATTLNQAAELATTRRDATS